MRYAEGSRTSTIHSLMEINKTVVRFGASDFRYTQSADTCVVEFIYNPDKQNPSQRHVKIGLKLPDRNSPEFTTTPARGRKRDAEATMKAWEQERARKYRELVLLIKAKLVACQSDITHFDAEFLPYLVIPGKGTIGEMMLPALDKALINGAGFDTKRLLTAGGE